MGDIITLLIFVVAFLFAGAVEVFENDDNVIFKSFPSRL